MRLQRLTGLERENLKLNWLNFLTQRYQTISNPKVLIVIKEELLEVKRRFGNERKTEIIDAVEDVSIEDLIPESDIVVVLSRDGYLRRKDLQEYTLQGRGGKGRKGTALQEEDEVALVAVTSTHRDIYLFTSKGGSALKGYVIPNRRLDEANS